MTMPGEGQPQKASSQAVTALVLSILGVICCGILAPISWYLGLQEQKAIREGRSPAAGQGLAQAAVIIGMIGTVLLVFTVIWIFFWGGMAMLSAFFGR